MRHLCAIALLALVGCAAAPPEENAEARAETIEEILTQPMNDEEYAEAQRCLATHAYRNVRVLDDRHVLFEGPGDRAWLNQLRSRCVGLRRNATLRFRLRDNRVCSLDSFEAVDTFFGRWDRSSATCTLGEFQPVTPEQVAAIRAALAE
ncbi:MAG: DUF6491 family protein [Pseudomonadales bacterium]